MSKYTIKIGINAVNDLAAHSALAELSNFLQEESELVEFTSILITKGDVSEDDLQQDAEICENAADLFALPIPKDV